MNVVVYRVFQNSAPPLPNQYWPSRLYQIWHTSQFIFHLNCAFYRMRLSFILTAWTYFIQNIQQTELTLKRLKPALSTVWYIPLFKIFKFCKWNHVPETVSNIFTKFQTNPPIHNAMKSEFNAHSRLYAVSLSILTAVCHI